MAIKRLLSYALLWLLALQFHLVRAQQYPVQITSILTPPYSVNLADYTSAEGNLQLIIQLRELDRPQYKVKLRLSIEGPGITIRTKATYNPAAIILQGGISEVLYGIDVKNYFNPDNLDFSGITKQEFVKTGSLPEGYYTFKFEVIDYVRNVVVSNVGMTNAWLILNDPPIINLPFNNDKVVATDPQNVNFSWTPRHTASPNAAFSTEYEFTMVELYPVDRNPNDAIRAAKPIFQIRTQLTSLNYGITETLLIPGRRYAFRVRAIDTQGRDLFKNSGYSEVFVFQFGDACISPTGVKAEALDDARVKLTWDQLDLHTGYGIQYRKKGNGTWQDQSVLTNSMVIPGLLSNTAYEFQVRGNCGTVQGQFSPTLEAKTMESNPKEFACGVSPPTIEIKTTPLQKDLEVDDVIKTADFEISVTEVQKNNDGSYKGKGKAFLPWFHFATVGVKFSGIKVNEDYRVFSGNVTTIYTKSSRFIANIDASGDDDAKGDGSKDGSAPDNNLIIEDTVNVNVYIQEIKVNPASPDVIIVVAADGTTTELSREKSDGKNGGYKDTVVKDSNGDTWIVSKDGTVTQGASTSGPVAIASLDQAKYSINFKAIADQEYGFDSKENALGKYETITVQGKEYAVSWKSVETGRLDKVLAVAGDEKDFPKAVGFKSSGTDVPSQAGADAATKQVYITGKVDGEEESIEAYVIVKGSEQAESQKVDLGKLNIKTYDQIRKKLIIVPVNDVAAPEASTLQTELNKIYQQAVVEWDVEIAEKFEYEPEDLKGIDSEESDFLSSFPEKMQVFNRTYRNSIFIDKNAYYIFLMTGTGSKRSGFMPFKRKYGYIFTDNLNGSNQNTTIAHELGHGAFRLRHTFNDEGSYYADQGSTTNLMDYSNGTALKKYQWDLVHDPENMNGWLEDDDESAAGIPCMASNFVDDNNFFTADQVKQITDAITRFNKYTKVNLYIHLPATSLSDEKIFEKNTNWKSCSQKGALMLINLKDFLTSVGKWDRNLVITSNLPPKSGIETPELAAIRTSAILPAFNTLSAKDNGTVLTVILGAIQSIKDHFRKTENMFLTAKGSRSKYHDGNVIALNVKTKDTKIPVTFNYVDRNIDPQLIEWGDMIEAKGLNASIDLTTFTNSKEFIITYDKMDVIKVICAKYEIDFANAGGSRSDEQYNKYGYDDTEKSNWSESGHHVSLKSAGTTNIRMRTDILSQLDLRSSDNAIVMNGTPVSLSTNEYRVEIKSNAGAGDYKLNAYYKGTEDVLAVIDVHVYDEKVLAGSMYVVSDNGNNLKNTTSLSMSTINSDLASIYKTIVVDVSLNAQNFDVNFNLNKSDGLDVILDAVNPNDNYEVEALGTGIQSNFSGLQSSDALILTCPIYKVNRLKSNAKKGDKTIEVYSINTFDQDATPYEYTIYDPVTKNSQSGLKIVNRSYDYLGTYELEFDNAITTAPGTAFYQRVKWDVIKIVENNADKIYMSQNPSSISLDEDVYLLDGKGSQFKLDIKKAGDGSPVYESYSTGTNTEYILHFNTPLQLAQAINGGKIDFYQKVVASFPLAITGVQKFTYTSKDYKGTFSSGEFIAKSNGAKTSFKIINANVIGNVVASMVEFDQGLSYNFNVTATPSTSPIIIRKYAATATGGTVTTGGMSGLNSANANCVVLIAQSGSNFGLKYAHEIGHKIFNLSDVSNADNIMNCSENGFASYYKQPFLYKDQTAVYTGRCDKPLNKNENQWKISRSK